MCAFVLWCSEEQVEIVQKVLSNSLKDFESLASSIESQKHFEKEREEANLKGLEIKGKRMTVAWDVRKTIKVSPKHLELLSTLEKDEDGSTDSLDSETSFEDFLHNDEEAADAKAKASVPSVEDGGHGGRGKRDSDSAVKSTIPAGKACGRASRCLPMAKSP